MPVARSLRPRPMESDLVDFGREYVVVVRRIPDTGASVYEIQKRLNLVSTRPSEAKLAPDSLLKRLLGDAGEEVKTRTRH